MYLVVMPEDIEDYERAGALISQRVARMVRERLLAGQERDGEADRDRQDNLSDVLGPDLCDLRRGRPVEKDAAAINEALPGEYEPDDREQRDRDPHELAHQPPA